MKCLRKGIALLTAAGIAAGMMTGCGGGAGAGGNTAAQENGQNSGSQGSEASGDQVVLRFAWWGGEERKGTMPPWRRLRSIRS